MDWLSLFSCQPEWHVIAPVPSWLCVYHWFIGLSKCLLIYWCDEMMSWWLTVIDLSIMSDLSFSLSVIFVFHSQSVMSASHATMNRQCKCHWVCLSCLSLICFLSLTVSLISVFHWLCLSFLSFVDLDSHFCLSLTLPLISVSHFCLSFLPFIDFVSPAAAMYRL